MPPDTLSLLDRFAIYEQLNLHQRCIDQGWGREQAERYNQLYWPEARFSVFDLRTTTFEGPAGLKRMFEIAGHRDQAEAHWRWFVWWKAKQSGIVSTGTYDDVFERRDGVWKCLERTSRADTSFRES